MRVKISLFGIVTMIILLCLFTSCNRRSQYAEMTETETNIVSENGTTDTISGEGTDSRPNSGGLYGNVDLKLLYQDYKNTYVEPNTNIVNTVYYIIMSADNGGRAYSKRTGEIIPLCKDPICDHQSCIFDGRATIVDYVVSENRIYLLMDKLEKYALYSFDLQMDDVQLMAEWDILDQPSSFYYYDNKIYYRAMYLDGEPVATTFVMDVDRGEAELLWGTDRFDAICGGFDSQIYYQTNGSLYSYNLLTKQDQLIVPSSVLDVNRGEIALSFRWANETTVSYSVYSTIYGPQNYEFNKKTGETNPCNMQNSNEIAHTTRFGDYFYFFVRHDTEEYQDDEHYNYYIQQPEEVFGMANPSGGELWRCPVSGGEKELVATMETDGIPDNIWDISTFDGKYLVVRYAAYTDYENEYTPVDDNSIRFIRFALIDVEDGSVYKYHTQRN